MVRALHDAGLEVFLDVVYNHTGEANHLGPTLSFRGIDNEAYYYLDPHDRRHYWDVTGTGNTLNAGAPQTLRLIMDSLRYWVTEMHVDGFRFDLASVLARQFYEVNRLAAFFDIIHQDPVLAEVKLIAEPWDIGPGGYQVGNFPVGWAEWNGKYRDTVRDYWRGAPIGVAGLAYRLTGSSDLYADDGRSPSASVNFVTAHDGFTLADLVSYQQKRNQANGEDNRDGSDDNRSWNCGVEGETGGRPRWSGCAAASSATSWPPCCISQGCPMILSGDELGRSQRGNNNAYCQDNETSWLDWAARRPRAARLHPAADRAPRPASGAPPAALLHREGGGVEGTQGRALAAQRRRGDDRPRLGEPRAPVAGDDPGRRSDPRSHRRPGSGSSTTPWRCCSTPPATPVTGSCLPAPGR